MQETIHHTGRKIAPNTGANATKFFTLATKCWKLVAKLATRISNHTLPSNCWRFVKINLQQSSSLSPFPKRSTCTISNVNLSSRMSVVSPTTRFAYIEVVSPTRPSRFAYTIKSFRLHGLSRFAYIKVVSPTLISQNVLWRWMNITACS